MAKTSSERQRMILERLQADSAVTIHELAEQLGISVETLHRDLNKLAAAGLLVKMRGGVRSAPVVAGERVAERACDICGGSLSPRTAFVVYSLTGSKSYACCAHCGLLAVDLASTPAFALAADFISGRMVNVREASYLVESRLPACCEPGILVLANAEDAAALVCGFGGTVMDYKQVHEFLQARMALQDQAAP
jgi:DNA-binding Lrp family transcriptional regulator